MSTSASPRFLTDVLAGSPKPGGKAPSPISFEFLRPLDEGDLELIERGETGALRKPLRAIRAAHHEVAKLVAQNYTNVEISARTGRSPTSVQQLRRDPAFKELVAFYANEAREIEVDVLRQAKNLSAGAIAEIQQRLEESPEQFSVEDLTKLAEKLMDRTGHGPTKTIQRLDTADAIKRLIERKQAAQAGKVIEREELEG